MEKSNGDRFIFAYNRLDQGLRSIYNIKQSLGFGEVIRKVAPINSIIKKYEDDLIECGRLRNAIVHGAGDTLIAEPNTEVVEKLEQIARIVTTPPRVIDVLPKRKVMVVDGDETIGKICASIFESGYSIVPVQIRGTIVGVINRKMIVDAIGAAVKAGVSVDTLLKEPVATGLDVLNVANHYEIAPSSITIDSMLFMFQQNRKLSAVIITKNGNYNEEPLAVVVTSDTLDLQSVLDNY
ncbi:MAG: hypothetical protein IJ542_02155 [Clostridia bacterium]|nr:hypothetical protein [Clostridia bacterium]